MKGRFAFTDPAGHALFPPSEGNSAHHKPQEPMKTTIHTYCFNVSNPDQAKEYAALKTRLKSQGLKCFETWGAGKGHYHPFSNFNGTEIELETKHLFNNQWNTTPCMGSANGWRVFDWAQDYPINFSKDIKRGHYLEQTPEMKSIRDNTGACGYCGKQEPLAKGHVFCPHCLDSEYLKGNQLELLRIMPVSFDGTRKPLSKAERDYLLPLYKTAQLHGSTERGKARIAAARAEIETDYENTVRHATAERDAKRWIAANCPANLLHDYIYYKHTGEHCFGWRDDGLSPDMESALLDVISEFPFGYTIKCADGRKLTCEG